MSDIPHILVADDHPLVLGALRQAVSGAVPGAFIHEANDFESLAAALEETPVMDLVLLDLSMPFMDGEETFKRLRGINPNVVVLLSTGFLAQAQERIDRMLAGGLAGFLRKPHRPDELLAQVQAILEKMKRSRVGCAAAR